jgi:hypothetical protein
MPHLPRSSAGEAHNFQRYLFQQLRLQKWGPLALIAESYLHVCLPHKPHATIWPFLRLRSTLISAEHLREQYVPQPYATFEPVGVNRFPHPGRAQTRSSGFGWIRCASWSQKREQNLPKPDRSCRDVGLNTFSQPSRAQTRGSVCGSIVPRIVTPAARRSSRAVLGPQPNLRATLRTERPCA